MTQSRINLPSGQDWLTQRKAALGLYNDKNGACYGVATTAILYILLRRRFYLNQILTAISNIPVDKFNDTVNGLEKKRVGIINQAKIAALQEMGITDEKELKTTDDKKAFFKLNQEKVKEKMQAFSKEEQILLKIPAFLQSIDINQHAGLSLRIFNKYVGKKTSMILPLLQCKEIEDLGGAVQVDDANFIGCYTDDELKTYVEILYKAFAESDPAFTQPIGVLLSNNKHTITLGLDLSESKDFSYIDANHLYFDAIDKDLVHKAIHLSLAVRSFVFTEDNIKNYVKLPSDKPSIFKASIHIAGCDQAALTSVIKKLKDNPMWQKLHAITKEKSQVVDVWNNNLLIIAAGENNYDAVKELIANDACINQRQSNGTTSLFNACQNGHIEVVKLLLENNAAVNLGNNNKVTPLYIACENGHTKVVGVLLKNNAKVNLANNNNATPLRIACEMGHTEVVKLLLENNADANLATNDNVTSLYFACYYGLTDIVKLLLENNAGINLTTKDKFTSLYMARKKGHTEIMKLFLEKNAEVNLINTALMTSDNKIIKKLIEMKTSTNEQFDFINRIYQNNNPFPVEWERIICEQFDSFIKLVDDKIIKPEYFIYDKEAQSASNYNFENILKSPIKFKPDSLKIILNCGISFRELLIARRPYTTHYILENAGAIEKFIKNSPPYKQTIFLSHFLNCTTKEAIDKIIKENEIKNKQQINSISWKPTLYNIIEQPVNDKTSISDVDVPSCKLQ